MNVNAMDFGGAVPAAQAITAAGPKQDSFSSPEATGEATVGNEEVKKMVDEMQSHLNTMNVSLEFSTYGEHGEHVAVIVADKETGEVIREIPAKEIQELYRKMNELAGVIFNRQV